MNKKINPWHDHEEPSTCFEYLQCSRAHTPQMGPARCISPYSFYCLEIGFT